MSTPSLSEARNLFARLPDRAGELPPVAVAIDGYELTASELERRQIVEAMATLLLEGDDEEQSMAATFFGNGVAPMGRHPEVVTRLWAAWCARFPAWRTPLGQTVGGLRLEDGPERKLVRQRFLDAPEQLPQLFIKLRPLPPEEDEEVWAALWRLLRTTQDVETLGTAVNGAATLREREVVQVLAERDTTLTDQLFPRFGTPALERAVREARQSESRMEG